MKLKKQNKSLHEPAIHKTVDYVGAIGWLDTQFGRRLYSLQFGSSGVKRIQLLHSRVGFGASITDQLHPHSQHSPMKETKICS